MNTSDPYRNFKSPCGSALEVSERVGRCLDPIFELVEGRSKIDPKSDQDLLSCCDRFANTEKCVRNVAKECLSGIAKTSTSTVSSLISDLSLESLQLLLLTFYLLVISGGLGHPKVPDQRVQERAVSRQVRRPAQVRLKGK